MYRLWWRLCLSLGAQEDLQADAELRAANAGNSSENTVPFCWLKSKHVLRLPEPLQSHLQTFFHQSLGRLLDLLAPLPPHQTCVLWHKLNLHSCNPEQPAWLRWTSKNDHTGYCPLPENIRANGDNRSCFFCLLKANLEQDIENTSLEDLTW